MPIAFCFLVLAIIVGLLPRSADASPELRLHQALFPADASILLPVTEPASLKIQLQAKFFCDDPDAEAGLFISVADSVISALQTRSPQAVELTIPPEQLRGVRESMACSRPGPQLLRDQLTAFGTLSCRSATGNTRTATVSQSLDIWVDCGEEPSRDDRPGEERLLD